MGKSKIKIKPKSQWEIIEDGDDFQDGGYKWSENKPTINLAAPKDYNVTKTNIEIPKRQSEVFVEEMLSQPHIQNIQKKYGNPNVTDENFPFIKNPFYFPLNNTIYLNTKNKIEGINKIHGEEHYNDVKEYITYSNYAKELPHAKQTQDKGTLGFIKEFITKDLIPHIELRLIGKNSPYDKKGTIEYEAHKIIQPEIEKEVYGFKNGGYIPIAQNGKKLDYSWSTQKQEPVKLATPNYTTTKTEGRDKPLTEKEIEEFRKHTENLKLQQQQKELAERKARVQQSIQAQNQPFSAQNLATETQAIGDKFRFFPNSPSDSWKGTVDDYLNPFKMIGDMASGLGALPYNVQQSNYGQAALSLAVPLVTGAIGSFGQKPAGSLFREQVYKAVDPVAYGMKEKLKSAPKTWLKNTISSDESKRALEIGKQLSNLNPEYFADDITRVGQNRLDAFRVGLKLPQKYDTFEKVAENTYRIKNMQPHVGEFSSVYNDLIANDYLKNTTGVYFGENPLVTIAKKHDKLTSPIIKTEFGDYSVNDLRRYLMKEKDELPAWEQQRIVEKAKNPEFTHSVYDADRQGIMGSFRWDIKKPSFENDYKLHFQSNDLWNLNPFEKRGAISVKPKEDLSKFHFKPFENFEALSFVGGKPFNIQNNFVLDPKTYKILEKYKSGGKIKTDPKGYWNKDNVIVKPSNIEGKGLFSNKSLKPNEFIGLAHIDSQPVGDIGNYHNHSEKPNAESILIGNKRFIKPKRKIKKGEEITVDYRLQPELEQPEDFQFDGNSVTEFPITMQQGGQVRQPIKGTKEQYQAYQDSLNSYNATKQYENVFPIVSNEESDKITKLKTTPNHLGIMPIGWFKKPDLSFSPYYKKPVQPIIYKPGEKKNQSEIEGIDGRTGTVTEIRNGRKYVFVDDKTTPWANEWIPVKEQPINIQSFKPDLLQGSDINMFNPIPFEKGTYFTRERQQQEQSTKGKKDYFDKKSGKLLGTYGNGGNISLDEFRPKFANSNERVQQEIVNQNIQGSAAHPITLPEVEISETPNWKTKLARERNSNIYASGRADYLPVESLMLPANLPFSATSNLGKAGVFAAETLNPLGGVKSVSKSKLNLQNPSVEIIKETKPYPYNPYLTNQDFSPGENFKPFRFDNEKWYENIGEPVDYSAVNKNLLGIYPRKESSFPGEIAYINKLRKEVARKIKKGEQLIPLNMEEYNKYEAPFHTFEPKYQAPEPNRISKKFGGKASDWEIIED